MMKSEIHMHSIYSDGEFSPQKLVEIARKNSVSVLSLTDHDTFEGIEEFIEASRLAGIEGFPGIGITVSYRDFQLHVLAYFRAQEDIKPELALRVKEMADARVQRMRELIDRVNDLIPDRFKGTIEFDNVRKAAEGVLARPHLAREMVRLKIVSSTRDAFDRYLAPYNVLRKNIDIKDALRLIRESGGIPVLAHPGERAYSLYCPTKGREYEDVPPMVEELASWGLMGLECVYPYHEKIRKVEYYKDLARQFGLIITGSRDFHGFSTGQSAKVLGGTRMDCKFYHEFKRVWSASQASVG